MRVDVRVLGTSRVVRAAQDDLDAAGVVLGPRKPRGLLAALALHAGTDVSADLLVDVLWDGRPPRGAHGTLQAYVSGLRRALEPGLGARERSTVLVTTDRGYRLVVGKDAVDAHRFAAEVRRRHRTLAPLASQLAAAAPRDWPTFEEVVAHADALEEALAAWEGRAYDDLGDHEAVTAERAALEELRLTAEEDRVLALLALGEHATVVAATEQMVGRHPWRERTRALHVLALTRSGRQADALGALRDVRQVLVEELGADPGPELRELERAVLAQDEVLQVWWRGPTSTTSRPGLPGSARPAASSAASSPPSAAPPAPPRAAGAPPMVGRAREQADLERLVEELRDGAPGCALVVGEAGIGKSRLLRHATDHARRLEIAVVAGRCSQVEGAPPFWPWLTVLRELEAAVPDAAAPVRSALDLLTADAAGEAAEAAGSQDAAGRAFRTVEAVSAAVVGVARSTPVLLTLEDLHWADGASLRVLRHLLDTASQVPVAVIATRRPWPEPRGPLAEVGEAFARRHATRLDLDGLNAVDAATLVAGVAGDGVSPSVAEQWAERAGGNPFFLIELARLRDPVTQVPEVPVTVRDLLRRRLDELDPDSQVLVVTAAVLGQEFSVDVLAAVVDTPLEELEDALQPALAAGLVRDTAPGRWTFVHALTREAVLASTSPTRLARLHARVAHSYESSPDVAALVVPQVRVAELARHWLAAGPTHVSSAWRAAVAAAEQSRGVFSHEEAAELMRAAVEAHRRDPGGTLPERHALLLTRAGDCQRAADWRGVVGAALEAISLARGAHDAVGVAHAAAEITRNCLWTPHEWGVVLEDTVDDLRWALRELGDSAPADRCRLMLSLAVELYYADARAERAALVEEGLALARRTGDLPLQWWATRAAWIASWTPELATARAALSAEGLELATRLGDPDILAISHAVATSDALELGDAEGYRRHAAEAERIARRRRLSFVLYTLAFVDLTLRTMADDPAGAQARIDELRRLRTQVSLPADELHEVGIALASAYWTEGLEQFVEPMTAAVDASGGTVGREVVYATLARTGRVEELRSRMLASPLQVRSGHWSTGNDAAMLAEIAASLRDPGLAAEAHALLAPQSGRMAVAGFSVSVGPVDGYLALAESTLGDPSAAAASAERAEGLAEQWGLRRYTHWLRAHRARLGF